MYTQKVKYQNKIKSCQRTPRFQKESMFLYSLKGKYFPI